MGTNSNGYGPNAGQRVVPQLSCMSCKDRKLKCNRLVPCSNCASHGVACVPVYRRRLPRGRYAQSTRRNPSPSECDKQTQQSWRTSLKTVGVGLDETDLRLESYLRAVGEIPTPSGEDGQPQTPSEVSVSQNSGAHSPNYHLSCPTSVPAEGTLQGAESHSPGYFGQVSMNKKSLTPLFGMEMEPNRANIRNQKFAELALTGAYAGRGSALDLLGSHHRIGWFAQGKMPVPELCQVYLQNVHPIIKILHRPTLSGWMLRGERYLAYPDDHPSLKALSLAVCYAATISMSDDQCQAVFHTSKVNSVSACQTACETAISNSDLLTSRDIITLQAFVLYL
ncbi:hypothetical protein BJX64DRAFT_193279 [Aspergillus heterothallicus]